MYTLDQIKSYLIDCIGYRGEELEGLTRGELMELVEDQHELSNYSN